MPSEVQELIGFLSPGANVEVAHSALEIVEGLSGSPEGIAALRPDDAVAQELVSSLLLCLPRARLSRSAATAIVNLSQDERICMQLIKAKACSRLIEYVVEGKTSDHDLVIMTLSNLTRLDAGVVQALQIGQGATELHGMRKVLSVALNPGSSDVMYEHIGGVLCNITQNEAGRKLLVENDLQGLRAAVDSLKSSSVVRRTGAAAAVKNVVMSAKVDSWFDQLIAAEDVLQKLLAVINGESPTETEDSVRENVAVSVSVIAQDEAGREVLMQLGAKDSVKKGYEYEEHPGTMEAMEAIGRAFLGVQEQDDDEDADGVIYIG